MNRTGNKNYIDNLRNKIIKQNHQSQTIVNIFYLIKDNLKDSIYVLRKFGWRRFYNFWFTKFFIVDEGGEFDLKAGYYQKFPSRAKLPFKIEIEHTTVCNKKCIFCAHSYQGQKIKQQQMSLEKFRLIIDSIPTLRWVNMAGIGSNFLNSDFIPMLEYAAGKQLNINFVDEFDFFSEEHSKKIIELGVNSIYISFDASAKETYEKIKKGCSFDNALSNIEKLIKLKKEMNSPFPVLHFRFIVNRLNYHEMPDYLDLIHSIDMRGTRARVEFIGLIPFKGIEEHYMPMEDVPREIAGIVYEKALEYNINLYFSHAAAELPSMSNCVRWMEPFVLVTGEVIQCCSILMQMDRSFLKKHSFGNIFEHDFKKIWNSKKYKTFRKQVVDHQSKVYISCRDCCSFDTSERLSDYGIRE